MNQKTEIIPFGKHKGMPVEVIQEIDPKYLEWLKGQSFVRENFNNLYQIIINNSQSSDDTPEHNAMQIKFLEDEICLGAVFCKYQNKYLPERFIKNYVKEMQEEMVTGQLDVFDEYKTPIPYSAEELIKMQLQIDYLQALTMPIRYSTYKIHREMEPKRGTDVCICFDLYYNLGNNLDKRYSDSFFIELKPTLSDDYPVVIRALKRLPISIHDILLVIGSFTARGCTLEQFKQICPCKVALLSDLQAT